jgi:hypothetical protein
MKKLLDVREVVHKLTGPIQATGTSEFDADRLANLKELTQLIDDLITDVALQIYNVDRPEASMRAIGKYAREFLRELRDSLAGDESLVAEGEQ